MSKISESVESVKRLSVMFKALSDLSVELEKISSLENHIKELEGSKDILLSQVESLKQEVSFAKDASNEIQVTTQGMIKNAEDKAQSIISQAEVKAFSLYSEAEKMYADNEKLVDKIMADVLVNKQVALSELQNIQDMIASESKKLESVQSQLDSIKSKI